jgi:hypothetical protein
MKCAAENYGFTGSKYRYLIKKPPRLHWDDTPKVVNIIGILQPMTDKVGALTDDCFTDLAGPLACDNQG